MNIKILGTGSYAPKKVLTNTDLEKIVDTNDEWISSRTGIKERHIAEDNESCSDIALQASLRAIEEANIKVEDLDLIVVASITGDKIFPSTACILQKKLQASNAVCFDVSAACSGFLYAIETVSLMLSNSSTYKKALVLGAEKMSSIVDWTDRNTCVLFGDGAGSMILEATDNADENSIIASKLGSNGDYEDILHIPAGGSAMPTSHETVDNHLQFLKMEGQEVFKLAVNSMVSACKETMEKAGVESSDIKWLIPHQANYRILKSVAKRLRIAEDNVFINVNKYGNTSAGSIGIAFDEMMKSNSTKKGDYVLLTAFGGGLTWGAMLLKI